MSTSAEYVNHLYDKSTDGYIQVVRFKEDKVFKIRYANIKNIADVTESYAGEEDTYITPNTSYKYSRCVNDIRQFRAFYIDIDDIEGDILGIAYKTIELGKSEVIPEPTMIVSSGRGLHIYWRIEKAPYQALNTWQELEDFLYYKLKPYGADKKATDAARILRLPGTINSKNNEECRVLYANEDITYSMYELREKYLNYSKHGKQLEFIQTKKQSKVISNKFFNSYSLHMTRAEDILELCKLRNYKVNGYRNMILHCYAYWIGIYIRDIEELEKKVIDLNNVFTEPVKESQIRAIIKCIPKAIDKFIEYEQGIRSGGRKRVTKGMKDKGGYWYKNETLINRLDITPAEQRKLKTIIGTEEKYRRKNEKRNKARRNENGLTPREQQKRDVINKVNELYIQGLKQVEIVEKLGISKGRVSQIIKELKKV